MQQTCVRTGSRRTRAQRLAEPGLLFLPRLHAKASEATRAPAGQPGAFFGDSTANVSRRSALAGLASSPRRRPESCGGASGSIRTGTFRKS